MDIDTALRAMKEQHEWNRANPDNPVCEGGCNRREDPVHLVDGICTECSDDQLQMSTGCRFGEPDCKGLKHEDCRDT